MRINRCVHIYIYVHEFVYIYTRWQSMDITIIRGTMFRQQYCTWYMPTWWPHLAYHSSFPDELTITSLCRKRRTWACLIWSYLSVAVLARYWVSQCPSLCLPFRLQNIHHRAMQMKMNLQSATLALGMTLWRRFSFASWRSYWSGTCQCLCCFRRCWTCWTIFVILEIRWPRSGLRIGI